MHVEKKTADSVEFWSPALQHHSTYTGKDLQSIIRRMIPIVLDAPTAKLNNVYNKYASSKMSQIAVKTAKFTAELQALSEMEL